MLRKTQPLPQWVRTNKHMRWSNPGRRWFLAKLATAATIGYVGSFSYSLYRAGTGPEDCSNFIGPMFGEPMAFAPLNLVSRLWGSWAADEYILPSEVHKKFIEAFVYLYDVNLSEVDPDFKHDYVTAQQFFCRRLVEGARPIDRNAHLVCPCDSVLVQYGECDKDMVVQVKGCKYPISELCRCRPAPLEKGMKRMFFIFYLRPKDYHHVHSPCDLNVVASTYVPGFLYPVSNYARKWIPMLYVSNERVVVQAKTKEGNRDLNMALVGATCVGNIKLAFDQRVSTNFRDPPEFAVKRNYTKGQVPLIQKGDDVGYFMWGSTTVLVVDVPEEHTVVPGLGSEVKVGEPLVALR